MCLAEKNLPWAGEEQSRKQLKRFRKDSCKRQKNIVATSTSKAQLRSILKNIWGGGGLFQLSQMTRGTMLSTVETCVTETREKQIKANEISKQNVCQSNPTMFASFLSLICIVWRMELIRINRLFTLTPSTSVCCGRFDGASSILGTSQST